jgi:hypothetical protein
MHPHRTGTPACRVPLDVDRVRPLHAERSAVPASWSSLCPGERVVGLGAPVSVLIRPEACEAPLLRARLHAEIAEHDRKRPEPGPLATPRDLEEADAWRAARGAWEDMLLGLDAGNAAPIELLWPTAYACQVLIGALRDAVARLQDLPARPDYVSVAEALDVARACLATWSAFEAIDHGGLQEVNL